MKILLLWMLIGVIVSFSDAPGRRRTKVIAPAPPDSIAARA